MCVQWRNCGANGMKLCILYGMKRKWKVKRIRDWVSEVENNKNGIISKSSKIN